jgi:hypothetical protein
MLGIGLIMDDTHNFQSSFFDHNTFIIEIVFINAFPDIWRTTFDKYFFHYFADNESSCGIEITVEKKYFTVGLFLDLFRLLT